MRIRRFAFPITITLILVILTGPTFAATLAWSSTPSFVQSNLQATNLPLIPPITTEPTFIISPSPASESQFKPSAKSDSTNIPAPLLALYNATDGANWTNKRGWNTDTPLNRWHGIDVNSNGQITHIHLRDNNLNGELPPELGDLTNLTELDLYANKLNGNIPPQLGNLSNLTSLTLTFNDLTGEIPAHLGNLTNITSLNLAWNDLTGEIPAHLANLPNLKSLSLGGNALTREIPPELGNLSNLYHLFLGFNMLTGEIPPELGNLSNLTYLNLGHNRLTAQIPTEFGNLTKLTRLYLDWNRLAGDIPVDLGNLSDLKTLHLDGNNFTGCLPETLQHLDLRLHSEQNNLNIPFCHTAETPQNNPPVFNQSSYARSVMSNAPIGTNVGDPIMATDPDQNTLSYSVSGTGATDFAVISSTGQITTATTFKRSEAGTTRTFTIVANDGSLSDTATVNVAVVADNSLIVRYDTNSNGIIEKSEVIAAINDYLFGGEGQTITKAEVIKLINLYLFG